MSFLASAAWDALGLVVALFIFGSIALFGTISIRNKQLEDQWDTLPEVEKKLHQRLREAGE